MESRKRKRLLIAIVAIGLAAFVCWFFLLRSNEPTYDGKTLSEWVMIQSYAPKLSARTGAREAIRAIGTNALPYAIKWIAFDPGSLREEIWEHEVSIPDWVWRLPIIGRVLDGGQDRADVTPYVFETLSDVADPAISRLRDIAYAPGNPKANHRALMSLVFIGPKAVPVLTNLLATTKHGGDPMLAAALKSWGTNASPLIPVFLQNLHTNDFNTVFNSIQTLSALHINSQETVPGLVTMTSHTNARIRSLAAKALGAFGSEAMSSLPSLNVLLTDTDEHVRTNAAAAIAEITGRPLR